MSPRRIRFRPPGIRPSTSIGPLGPFRGRLGLHWVIAPLLVGLGLAVAAWFLLFRPGPGPAASFVPVGSAASFHDGSARGVDLPGVFVGMTGGRLFAVEQEDGCSLAFCGGRYVDCRGAAYGLDGRAAGGVGALDLLPVQVYRNTVYVDPDHPLDRSPAPAPAGVPASCG